VFGITRQMDNINGNYFVTIMASIIGGLITLTGVVVTILYNIKQNEERDKKINIPKIFVPIKFDICDATQMQMKCSDQSKRVSNKHLYLKNSDCNYFSVASLQIRDKIFVPSMTSLIEKGELFCLSFYYKNTLEKATLELRSIDNNCYCYSLYFNNDKRNKLIRIESC